jgi:threonyl-tRNA synthetase
MPDMHTFCEDLEKSKKEFKKQFKLCMSWMRDIGFSPKDYETGIRFTEAFYKDNKEFIHSLVKLTGRPALIEVWKKRYAYFDPKFEFNVVDALGKASALSTVQIDHENARRYGIKFIDRDGKERYPLILHASISGGIERCLYAMLEKIWLESKKGKNPILPLWLSPTQVRLCTVSDRYLGYAQKIADKLEREQIRVDIDDRVESVQRKIRDAEVEWIPLIIVIGEKEEKSGKLAVRFRETGKVKKMKLEDIIKHVHGKTKGYPFRPLSLPRLISKRPKFVG